MPGLDVEHMSGSAEADFGRATVYLHAFALRGRGRRRPLPRGKDDQRDASSED
jgi:hypothetical protein